MGLSMQAKRELVRATSNRYRKANKKGKTKILDEFVESTGYHRKYALAVLAHYRETSLTVISGKTVTLKADATKRKPGGGRKPVYGEAVLCSLKAIWAFFDFMCGKRLAPFLRDQMVFLKPYREFNITKEVQRLLLRISPATIDRLLRPERTKWQLKGRSATKPGNMVKRHIPIRVFYDWNDCKPGFFELDTVVHDGGNARGEYCCTLSATDVASGWVELRALRNRAHAKVLEAIRQFPAQLPFPLLGIDSDNGGEFINHQLWNWCTENGVAFTRSRSYHKNDNCFIEQKNDMAVRHTVGYHRYDTQDAADALALVYRSLCPLINFFYPSTKLVAKERHGARVQKTYDLPKTPFQRLLDSPDLPDTVKDTLRRRAATLHPVKLKRLVFHAQQRLLDLRSPSAFAAEALKES